MKIGKPTKTVTSPQREIKKHDQKPAIKPIDAPIPIKIPEKVGS